MKPKFDHGNLAITVCLVGMTVAYVMVFLLPRERAIGRLREEASAKQDYVVQRGQLGTVLQTTQEQFDKTRQYNATWKQASEGRHTLSSFFGRISALARAAGATTTRFDPEPVVDYDNLRKVPVRMDCTGSFAQICRFVQELECLPRIIWVEDMRLEKLPGNTGIVKCELDLAIFVDNPDNSDQAASSG